MSAGGGGGGAAEGGCLALLGAVLAVYFAVQVVLSFTSWTSLGIAVLVIAVLFGLWWLFQSRDPSGLDIARKAVSKLEAEEQARKWWRL